MHAGASPRKNGFTLLSSSEWKEMTANRPPCERVVTDYHKARPKAEQTVGQRKALVKAVEFAVYADPECKEDLGGGVDMGSAPCTPHGLLDGSG